jgi:hypothetical protein
MAVAGAKVGVMPIFPLLQKRGGDGHGARQTYLGCSAATPLTAKFCPRARRNACKATNAIKTWGKIMVAF